MTGLSRDIVLSSLDQMIASERGGPVAKVAAALIRADAAEIARLRGQVEALRENNRLVNGDLMRHVEQQHAALDAAESILRYCPEFSANCNGTKPNMTTARALAMVRDALGVVA